MTSDACVGIGGRFRVGGEGVLLYFGFTTCMSSTARDVDGARGMGHCAGSDVQLGQAVLLDTLLCSSIANITAAVWLQAPQLPAIHVHVACSIVLLVSDAMYA